RTSSGRLAGRIQLHRQAVQEQPSLGRQPDPLAHRRGPALLQPLLDQVPLRRRQIAPGDAGVRAQRQPRPLQRTCPILGPLLARPGGPSLQDPTPVPRPVTLVPPAHPAEEGMRTGAKPDPGRPAPVRAVVATAKPRAREVGDLVVLEAHPREPLDGEQVLVRIAVLIGKDLTAITHPAPEWR